MLTNSNQSSPIRDQEGYTVVHSDAYSFCLDPSCPDKEDPTLLAPVIEDYENGLLTPDEATRTIQGRML